MDVVRRNIEALRGRVEIQSVFGKGTTFLIKLPLTLAILDGPGAPRRRATGSSCRPSPSASRCGRSPSRCTPCRAGPQMIQVRNALLPLASLGELLGIGERPPTRANAPPS